MNMNSLKPAFTVSHPATRHKRLLIAVLAVLLLGVLTALPALASSSGTWTPTGNLINNSDAASLTLLQNGQALAASASGAELYTPSTGTWTITGSMNAARNNFTATLLNNGNVLAVGGYYSDPVKGPIALASAELYNPSTGTWTYTGSLHTARWNHSATLLQNGEVLVAGGESFGSGGTTNVYASAELYNPSTGTWTTTGSLHTARYEQTATLLSNGQVLVAGGNTGVFVGLASAELYTPSTGTWKTTRSMTTVRRGHTMTLLQNGQVLVAGGADGAGNLLASTELYTPSTGTWTLTGSLPHLLDGFTATLLTNGQVLAAAGNDGGYIADAELYDPSTGAWTATGSLNQARAYQTAALLQNGEVLVAGGAYNVYYPTYTAEYYTP
jgi:Galactose oxidase, central domain